MANIYGRHGGKGGRWDVSSGFCFEYCAITAFLKKAILKCKHMFDQRREQDYVTQHSGFVIGTDAIQGDRTLVRGLVCPLPKIHVFLGLVGLLGASLGQLLSAV